MLSTIKAFSGFSVDDLQKARDFYGKILGLKVAENKMGLLELQLAGETTIIIYPKDDHVPATFTILNFPVVNIDAAVDELNNRGVTFEQYNTANIKTDQKGISRGIVDVAWFKDAAGNILSLVQEKDDAPG